LPPGLNSRAFVDVKSTDAIDPDSSNAINKSALGNIVAPSRFIPFTPVKI